MAKHLVDHSTLALGRYSELWSKKAFTDVTFLVGNEEMKITAHRVILSSSPVLSRMFSSGMQESLQDAPIRIPNYNADDFNVFLEYFYTGKASLAPENIRGVLGAADQYAMEELKDSCLNYLAQNISRENVLEFVEITKMYGDKKAAEPCQNFFLEIISEVLKSKEFLDISKESLMEILRDDRIMCPEEVRKNFGEKFTENLGIIYCDDKMGRKSS